ncbi:MAG: hypothetical protein KME31_05945 [Tolypothrix carrinoi HA7290-LM1]|nr:hypothetical protein [Tolypothrix carrinoi HA7290-LM1]
MLNAQCPMPNDGRCSTQVIPKTAQPNLCPMPNAQCPLSINKPIALMNQTVVVYFPAPIAKSTGWVELAGDRLLSP